MLPGLLWRTIRRALSAEEKRILDLLSEQEKGLSRDDLLTKLGQPTMPCAERSAAIKTMQSLLYRSLVKAHIELACCPGMWHHQLTITPRGKRLWQKHQVSKS